MHACTEDSNEIHTDRAWLIFILIVLGLCRGFLALSATDANAVVCARGMYRAGCVGPYGAVGVRRSLYRPRAVVARPVVYGRRGYVVRRRW